jgi:hypothetical protein
MPSAPPHFSRSPNTKARPVKAASFSLGAEALGMDRALQERSLAAVGLLAAPPPAIFSGALLGCCLIALSSALLVLEATSRGLTYSGLNAGLARTLTNLLLPAVYLSFGFLATRFSTSVARIEPLLASLLGSFAMLRLCGITHAPSLLAGTLIPTALSVVGSALGSGFKVSKATAS